MTVDFTCQRCEGSFELEYAELMEGTIECPNCDHKAPRKLVEELNSALDELLGRIGDLRGKFAVSLSIESDELPGQLTEDEDEDEDEDDDEDDELDGDDELDDDDDR